MLAERSGHTVRRPALALAALVAVLSGPSWAPAAPAAAETASAAPSSRTVRIAATGGTYTDSRHPRKNYAGRSSLRISKARFTTYLAFPAPALLPGETITGARLLLTVTRANKAARKSGGIRVSPVAANRSVGSITGKLAPKPLSGTIAGPVRARPGRVTVKFSAKEAAHFLAGGSALRLRYSSSRADVRIARSGAKAPLLEFTTAGTTGPAPGGGPFSIAVIPDTQEETTGASDPRFANRTGWLVDNREQLKLAYVLHTGDVVNWGWLAPAQFTLAKSAIHRLSDAGIPFALTVGNHDTAAVGWNGTTGSTGYGGSAYASNPECLARLTAEECQSKRLLRDTGAFNAAFPLGSIRDVGGAFEAGKVDNLWTTFGAGGTKWLVLTLEPWPRTTVVAWARTVVASHPGHNVIVQTHSYLTEDGAIDQTNGGYGATSGQYLYDNLIGSYANIKLVFSGHTGNALRRVDTGLKGNRIVSYLQAFHSGTTNPVRIVTIDPASGLVTSRVLAPFTDETWTGYSTSDTISLIR